MGHTPDIRRALKAWRRWASGSRVSLEIRTRHFGRLDYEGHLGQPVVEVVPAPLQLSIQMRTS